MPAAIGIVNLFPNEAFLSLRGGFPGWSLQCPIPRLMTPRRLVLHLTCQVANRGSSATRAPDGPAQSGRAGDRKNPRQNSQPRDFSHRVRLPRPGSKRSARNGPAYSSRTNVTKDPGRTSREKTLPPFVRASVPVAQDTPDGTPCRLGRRLFRLALRARSGLSDQRFRIGKHPGLLERSAYTDGNRHPSLVVR